MNTHISVQPLDPETYEVVAVEGLLKTRHRVAVPHGHLNVLRLWDADIAAVVRETFLMVLEREPTTSVPAVATLEAIGNRYPDFWAELQRRLAPPLRYPGPGGPAKSLEDQATGC